MPSSTRLSDITWGGRIRSRYQHAVSDIAESAAHTVKRFVRGSMVHSSETVTYYFLDGGVSETRGVFGPGSGMSWFGTLAKAHVLYEMGEDPSALLRSLSLPSKEELRTRVRSEADAARRKAETEGA